MDILKRSFAPITKNTWDEIDSAAREAIIPMLSARRVLDVKGPKGFKYSGVQDGRLEIISQKNDKVQAGIRKVVPLVELRIPLELLKWTLDDIERGAKDVNFDPLEEAARNIALAEEEIIYNGNKSAKITGLVQSAGHKLKIGSDANEILKSIGQAIYKLYESSADAPYDLIVSKEIYEKLNVIYQGASLIKVISKLIGGSIIRSKVLKGALLIPHKNEDFEFVLGSDFAVGYEGDCGESVRIFITESFTFRVLNADKIVYFS